MIDGSSLVEVDGRLFSVRSGGPTGPLEVRTVAGGSARLVPWSLDLHLAALDRHVHVDDRGVRFDEEGFAREVLDRSGVPASLFDELAPVALFWAAGGAAPAPPPGRDGWLDMGSLRVQVRPWTLVERSRALDASTTTRPDGARELSLPRYLRAMIEASVVAVDPPGAALPAAALIDALVALNVGGDRIEDHLVDDGGDGGRALALLTLRLCKALGWTPSQVWSAPAAEIDRLLSVLAVAEPSIPAPRSRRGGLADHPDSVIIQMEDG